MTALQSITLHQPNSLEHPSTLDQPSRDHRRGPARTASGTARVTAAGPPPVLGRWARTAAVTGRSILDDLADWVDTVLTPTGPQGAAVFLSVLAR